MRNLYSRVMGVLQLLAVVFFFIIVPFTRTSNGEILIRFDVNSLKFFLFGHVISFDDFFTLSVFVLFLIFLFIFVSQILGKIWCGWMCPQSFSTNLITKLSSKFKNKKIRKIADIIFSLIIAFIIGTFWMFYFVSPYDYIATLKGDGGMIMLTIWIILVVVLFIDFAFIRYKWCKSICPYARFQFLLTDDNTLYIGMKHGEDSKCIKCLACVKSCPVKIDPRATPNGSCIYCENCIKACHKVLSKRGGKSILGYNWGSSLKFKPGRVNLIITFGITILLFCVFLFNVFGNEKLNMKILDVQKSDNGSLVVKAKMINNQINSVIVNFSSSLGPDSVSPKDEVLEIESTQDIILVLTPPKNSEKNIRLKAFDDNGLSVERDIKIN